MTAMENRPDPSNAKPAGIRIEKPKQNPPPAIVGPAGKKVRAFPIWCKTMLWMSYCFVFASLYLVFWELK